MLSFIGIPYSKLDCYGIVKKFYKEKLGIEIVDVDYKPASDRDMKGQDKDKLGSVVDEARRKNFYEVQEPKYGDIILIRILGLPIHVGIFLNKKQFLHSHEKAGSCVEKIKDWEKRILGYYRYDKV